MIEIGINQTLTILRETSVGLFLGDDSGDEVLLPNKYCPEKFDIGDDIEVFIYLDSAERKIATTLTPALVLHEFALLEVVEVTNIGAFVDWGLEKHLLVPFSEQRMPMEAGRFYMIYLDLDTKTNRLFGSNKIERKLQNTKLTVDEGDEVELLVYRKTELGYSVIVNNIHKGLIFANSVFTEPRIGERLRGFILKVREDNKLDISLQPVGYRNFNTENTVTIERILEARGGFLPYTDKSPPEDIYATFGMSKKAFKKALGSLYKERKVAISDEGISLKKE